MLNELTGNKKGVLLPEGYSDSVLANKFLDYFDNKINSLIADFEDVNYIPVRDTETEVKLTSFSAVGRSTIKRILGQVKPTYCDNDPFQVSLIMGCDNFELMIDTTTNLVNKRIENGRFPNTEKRAKLTLNE